MDGSGYKYEEETGKVISKWVIPDQWGGGIGWDTGYYNFTSTCDTLIMGGLAIIQAGIFPDTFRIDGYTDSQVMMTGDGYQYTFYRQ